MFKIKRNREPTNVQENASEKAIYKMITEIGNGYYAWNGKLYESDIVRACVRPRTKAIGKMVAKHIRTSVSSDGVTSTTVNPDAYMRFLLEEPNAYMTGQMMQEKVANQLALNGNAYILIIRDSAGVPCGLYPIPATAVEAKYDVNNNLELKFYYLNGKSSQFPYSEIIHLREDYVNNDLFGENPATALVSMMNVVTTIDQGIVNAIKNSAVIKWLLKFTTSMRDEDLRMKANEFAENYLSLTSSSLGVAAVDSKAEATQITPHDYIPNAMQMDSQTKRIYAFFNTNANIVTSKYTEDEWIAYYEQSIEPVGVQMSNEYTRKLFTRRERGFGNKIVFESGNLTYASMSTKLQLVTLIDRGVMTPNEVRSYFNLAPIDGGDNALLRKDTGKLAGGDD